MIISPFVATNDNSSFFYISFCTQLRDYPSPAVVSNCAAHSGACLTFPGSNKTLNYGSISQDMVASNWLIHHTPNSSSA
jgi:hypothetical protein